jgi:hypothetical protein
VSHSFPLDGEGRGGWRKEESIMADILIQGGEVLDPGQGLRGRLDTAVSQGKIT